MSTSRPSEEAAISTQANAAPPASKAVVEDALASIVVFLVALPLCMGIAIASGVAPALGLITGVVGGLVVGFLQGAPLQVSGPAAGLAVIIAELAQKHGLGALGVMVFAAGVIQLAAGLAKGGRWFRAVPPSVIHGMLAGIGVLIFSSQFHVMVDDTTKGSALKNILSIPMALWKGIIPNSDLPHDEAALTGLVTISVLLLWTKFAPKKLKMIPGALVGVVVATLIANAFAFPIAHVALPDSLIGGIVWPSKDSMALLLKPGTWLSGLGLAVVASAETLLCATAVDRMHNGPRTDYNRELSAQGVGNAICGVLGALPMTGVIVRSSANVQAGAKTRVSAILHGVWMLLLVVAFPGVLRLVPISSLAAILVFTGFKLVNVGVIKQLRTYGKTEVAIYFVTIVAIVGTDLLKGVLTGLAIAVAKLLLGLAKLDMRVEDDPVTRRTVMYLRGSASFLRLPDVAEELDRVPPDRELTIHIAELRYLDHSILELLSSWEAQHRSRGGDVIVDWEKLNARYHLGRRSGVESSREGVSK